MAILSLWSKCYVNNRSAKKPMKQLRCCTGGLTVRVRSSHRATLKACTRGYAHVWLFPWTLRVKHWAIQQRWTTSPSYKVVTYIALNYSSQGKPAALTSYEHLGVLLSHVWAENKYEMWFFTVLVPDNCTEGSVRLLFGSTTRSGTVQVCVNGTWGSICDQTWDSRDATVICKQLGFTKFGNCSSL